MKRLALIVLLMTPTFAHAGFGAGFLLGRITAPRSEDCSHYEREVDEQRGEIDILKRTIRRLEKDLKESKEKECKKP